MAPSSVTAQPKRLSDLAQGLAVTALPGDPVVRGLSTDSRCVKPGDLFIAIRGFAADGHRYVDDAIARGAAAVIIEDEAFKPGIADAVPVLQVDNTRRATALLADEFYDHPSGKLTLVGVTGTNGKTTVSLLLDSIFRAAGKRTGVVGTLGRTVDGVSRNADRTTPDAVELQALLAEMVRTQVTHVAMEVSSHALDLDRTHMCRFAGAVFTNLTQDHLDYHHDLDEYLQAKLGLFTTYADMADADHPMIAAINVDNPAGLRVAEAARCPVIRYGTNGGSEIRARSISVQAEGARFELVIEGRKHPVCLRLTGHFNVHNALAAAACCHGLGFAPEEIVAGLEGLAAVPGRFECVSEGRPYTVIVDYAHTPAALQNVLTAARALNPRRLLCVMGCGGDRDRGKRPKMGKVAMEYSDFSIVTSDNPRTEDPLAIIEDIKGGLASANYLVEPDRREAIFKAVEMCEPGDILIIAGKGHETYQEFADHRNDFDDRTVAREAIAARSI